MQVFHLKKMKALFSHVGSIVTSHIVVGMEDGMDNNQVHPPPCS